MRHQATENEAAANSSLGDLRVGVSCPGAFKIQDGTGKVLFETRSLNLHKNGGVRSIFRSDAASSSYLVQFEDMSLHHIASEDDASTQGPLAIKWSREEALSGITQIELIAKASGSSETSQTFDYVKQWDHNLSFDKVPQRILQRYAENAAHLMKLLVSLKDYDFTGTDSTAAESDTDIYGFKKTLVALTSYGKIFGLSSYDGSLFWSSDHFPSTDGTPRKVFIRQSYNRADEYMQAQVVSVFSNSLKFMSSDTGAVLFS